jgi:hypothetical protein
MAKKKKAKKKEPWCLKDLDWDEFGRLYIKNPILAQQIYDAIYDLNDPHHPLRIVRDDPDWVAAEDDNGGVGNPKQNMQCPC